jgi:FixJ family two-component response regulator
MPESPLEVANDPVGNSRGSVFLVEDELAVRRSLALLLQLHGYTTLEFVSAEDFLAAAPRERPACALVDIRLPGMSGLALQERMVREGWAAPVLLMTAQGDAATARTALLQGASDFLEKPIDEYDLFAALETALRRDTEHLASTHADETLVAQIAGLSRREKELFESLTAGRQLREIAEQFGCSIAQVEALRAVLMEKLQVRRLTDLFRLRFRVDACLAAR